MKEYLRKQIVLTDFELKQICKERKRSLLNELQYIENELCDVQKQLISLSTSNGGIMLVRLKKLNDTINVSVVITDRNEAIVKKVYRSIDHTFIYALRPNGEWIPVLEGAKWPEDCYFKGIKIERNYQ